MRITRIVAAIAVLTLAAAGCGGDDDDKSASKQTSKAPDPAELTVWQMGGGSKEQTAFLDKVEAEFKQKHPSTDVKIKYVPWQQATPAFQKAAAGGQGPDVTEIGNTDVQSWIEQGALADVTKNLSGWAEGKTLNKGALANDQSGGKTYAVPWYGGVRAVWYRKDWFSDLGIQTPKTWAELVTAAKTIQDKKKVPGMAAPTNFTNGLLSFIWGAGGEVAVKEGGEWVGKLDQPQAQEGVSFYTNLVTKDKVAPTKYIGRDELQGPQQDFALGKVGMYIDGSWAYPQLEKVSKKNSKHWAAFPIPGKNGGTAPVFAGGSDLAVWKDSKHKDVAFDYITVLNSKKNSQVFADTLKFLPPFTDVLQSTKYQNDPLMAAFAQAASGTVKFTPTSKGWADFELGKKILPNALKNIMQGKAVDAELKKANDQASTLLNP